MRIKRIRFIVILFIIFASVFSMSFAITRWYTDTLLDVWSVDSGKHLDWSGTTQYLGNWYTGINIWNNYKNGVIREDVLATINDVTISDVSFIATNINARTEQFGTGHSEGTTIKFATSQMNQLSNLKKDIVCTHEIGHTLGLNENRNSTIHVMYDDMTYNTSNNNLSAEDKSNYDYMYNFKY